MPFQIRSLPLLKEQRTVWLGLPLWWEQGNNFPYHKGPGEWMSFPYLKCPQRRLYSAWKIADIYLRRSAEYWDALSASLRKLEIFSVRTSAIFPYAGPQLSAERSAEVCGHQCGRPHGLVQTSAWIGADVRMDGCGCLRKSAWVGVDIRRARGSVRVAPPAV